MYIGLRPDGKFIPGQLGMGLVEGIYFSRLLSLYQKKQKQAQRRAAGDRSGRKCSKKYVFMSKNSVPMVKSVTFGSLGPLLPFSKAYPPKLIKNGNFQK